MNVLVTEGRYDVQPKGVDRRPKSRFRADRLADLMRSKGLTQGDLAQKIGVSPPQVSRWLSGINEPNSETLVRIADEMEITADYLLGRVDDNVAYYRMPELSPDEWEFILSIRDGSFADALKKLAEEMKKRDAKPPEEGSQKA